MPPTTPALASFFQQINVNVSTLIFCHFTLTVKTIVNSSSYNNTENSHDEL